MEQKKNLCAQIPLSLHTQVSEAREAAGQTTSEYITNLLIEYYNLRLKAKTAGQGTPKRNILPGCFSWGRNVCAVKTELLQNPTCFFSMSGIAFPGLSSYNV
ncbi:hypothetical protein AALA80_12010 [Oscillospiraceae bacterium 50-60]